MGTRDNEAAIPGEQNESVVRNSFAKPGPKPRPQLPDKAARLLNEIDEIADDTLAPAFASRIQRRVETLRRYLQDEMGH